MAMNYCSGGRVRHPATHRETVTMRHPEAPRNITVTGEVCQDHRTSADDWEVDGWEVVSIKRRRI